MANFAYTYDSLGNLTGRSDADAKTPNIGQAPNMSNETLTYDNLYRLVNDQLPGGVTKTVRYDALGDITSKSDTGTYAYDANGNQLQGDGYTTVWTAFNKPQSWRVG